MRISVLIVDDAILPPGQETALLDTLPAARRAALAAIDDVRARHRSLLGSRLLAAGLARLGAPRDILASLRYPAGAKPALDPPWDFSVAHCEGRVTCAISADGAVGIDVEPLGLAASGASTLYLSPAERAATAGDPVAFLALWTRKEAVAKAAGMRGLRDLRAVGIDGSRGRAANLDWHTLTLDVGAGFVAHLACASPVPIVDLQRLGPETLL